MVSESADKPTGFQLYLALAREIFRKVHSTYSPNSGNEIYYPSAEVRRLLSNAISNLDSMTRFEEEYFHRGRTNLFDSLMDVCSSYLASVDLELAKDLRIKESAHSIVDPNLLERFKKDVRFDSSLKMLADGSLHQHLAIKSVRATHEEFYLYRFCVGTYYFGRARQEVESLYEKFGYKKEVFEYVKREIGLKPEYRQSFISILSYFTEILKSKQPDVMASVSIEQDGDIVRLTIRTEEGSKEIIEQELKSYGLVVSGKISPDEYIDDPIGALILQNKLDLARTEIKSLERILESERANYQIHIDGLQSQLKQVGNFLQYSQKQNERLTDVVSNLSESASNSGSKALETIVAMMRRGLEEEDKPQVLKALEEIKKTDPSLLEKIHGELFKASLAGAGGNMIYSWVLAIIDAVPR